MSGGALQGLHVLVVAEYYGSGGTRTYIRRLLEFYARQGARITLVPSWPGDDPEMRSEVEHLGGACVPYADVAFKAGSAPAAPPVWSSRDLSAERRAFREFSGAVGADMITVSAGTPGMLLGAAGACRLGNYVLHTYPHGRRQQILGRWVMGRLIEPGMRIIAVSRFEEQVIKRMWGRRAAAATTVIPNTSGPVTSRADVVGGPPMVLTVSWVEPYKDPRTWVAVAERITALRPDLDARFVWLGEGAGLADARADSAASDAADVIEFAGHRDDVEEYYRRASVYLQPSIVENMSLAVLDAQRLGVPTVVTRVGGLAEIVADGATGRIVQRGDVEAMSAAVIGLIENQGEARRLALAGQRHYEAQFSPDAWERRMIDLHERG